MNSAQKAAVAQAFHDYLGSGPTPKGPVFSPAASVSLKSQTSAALKSLEEPEAQPNVIRVGAVQIERKGGGDVQEVNIAPKRDLPKTKSLDGNITNSEFERVW
jgi:hypothetical protein